MNRSQAPSSAGNGRPVLPHPNEHNADAPAEPAGAPARPNRVRIDGQAQAPENPQLPQRPGRRTTLLGDRVNAAQELDQRVRPRRQAAIGARRGLDDAIENPTGPPAQRARLNPVEPPGDLPPDVLQSILAQAGPEMRLIDRNQANHGAAAQRTVNLTEPAELTAAIDRFGVAGLDRVTADFRPHQTAAWEHARAQAQHAVPNPHGFAQGISDQQAQVLVDAQIGELEIFGGNLRPEALRILAQSPSLTALSLRDSNIGPAGAVALSAARVGSLDLAFNHVLDGGALALAGMNSLTRLNLARNGISDVGVQALLGHSGIRDLDLTGNNLSAPMRQTLEQARLQPAPLPGEPERMRFNRLEF